MIIDDDRVGLELVKAAVHQHKWNLTFLHVFKVVVFLTDRHNYQTINSIADEQLEVLNLLIQIFIRIADYQPITELVRISLNDAGYVCKKGVGNIGYDQTNGVGFFQSQSTRQLIRTVTELLGKR